MKEVVDKLIKLNKTVSTMESCTGGFIASQMSIKLKWVLVKK